MHKWYVVQVLAGQEKKVKRALDEFRAREQVEDLIDEIMLPTQKVSEIKGGERKVVEKRIWPGYLLLKMVLDERTWQYVKQTQGVIDFLGGGSPTALTDDEVEEILSDLRAKQETVTQRQQFEVGGHVKITDGVFINFIGEITEVFPEKGRLNVVLSIFGRDTPVHDLEFWQVEEVTEEAQG